MLRSNSARLLQASTSLYHQNWSMCSMKENLNYLSVELRISMLKTGRSTQIIAATLSKTK